MHGQKDIKFAKYGSGFIERDLTQRSNANIHNSTPIHIRLPYLYWARVLCGIYKFNVGSGANVELRDLNLCTKLSFSDATQHITATEFSSG
jgi:hypothetical protein